MVLLIAAPVLGALVRANEQRETRTAQKVACDISSKLLTFISPAKPRDDNESFTHELIYHTHHLEDPPV